MTAEHEDKTEKGQLKSSSTQDAPVRVLAADLYDTLEFSALVYGGIGARYFRDKHSRPLCMIGHKLDAVVTPREDEEWRALGKAAGPPINAGQSDAAVRRINGRCGFHLDSRVPFEEWCAELGIIRGES